MSVTAEEVVCLVAQGIDDNNGDFGVGSQARGLSYDGGGFGGGQGIDDASEGLETTTEAVGD